MSSLCTIRLVARWPRPPLSTHSTARCRHAEPHARPYASTSERSRKLPDSEGRGRLLPWQRSLLIGAVAGFAAAQAWKYYHETQSHKSFLTYKLVAKEPVSSTASIFHLAPTESSTSFEQYKEAWRQGVWNVHFKQPQIQIVRAYTPLPPVTSTDQKKEELRFLIRYDPHGEVSSYLHRLPLGSSIELRGPNLEYRLAPEVKQVVFYAGGTGIAPALQIAHAMFDAEGNQPARSGSENATPGRKLHILWANRRREDCLGGVNDPPPEDPMLQKRSWGNVFGKRRTHTTAITSSVDAKGVIVQELEDLKQRYPGMITVEYFVNSEGTYIDEEAVFQSLSRFDEKDFSRGVTASDEQRQIIISGPNGFITYLAGPKEWKKGREEQGNVSRIVAHAIAQNPHHVKVWKI